MLNKQVLCAVFVCSAIFGQASPILAVNIEQVPNPRRINSTWVSDTANMLSDNTEAQLNSMISQLEAKNGSEIAVVTVPETSPSASPKEFATKLFNNWGIGKRGKNNGVLFLISKGDRRVEIETGSGLVTLLPNSKVNSIVQEQITPKFKQGKFDEGILSGTQAIVVTLDSSISTSFNSPNLASQSSDVSFYTDPYVSFFIYSMIVTGVCGCLWLATRKKSRNNYSSSRNSYRSSNNHNSSFYSSNNSSSSSYWSSNDSSSCGGSDFGGGSSSGDGGGGSW